jgi:hypothetical protein
LNGISYSLTAGKLKKAIPIIDKQAVTIRPAPIDFNI